MIAALAVVIAILAVKLSKPAKSPEVEAPAEPAVSETAENAGEAAAEEEPAGNGVSYTVSTEELTEEVMNTVVASCGDDDLTNRDLNLYYWQQFYSFSNSYGQYMSYLVDTSKGLDLQMYDEESTWQQMFLNSAAEMYRSVAAVYQEATAKGFTLGDENQAVLDNVMEQLSTAAQTQGFDDVDGYLASAFGPAVDAETYAEFLRRQLIAADYLNSLLEKETFTAEDVEKYYNDNAESFETSHILKVDKPVISVRHVLIMPEEQDEEGNYTDEAWAAAEQKANELYAQWQSGEATEDSFAQLAKDNSADGNAASGGLYTGVYPGQMVDSFNDWCFADDRQVGDSGVVKTNYGYHIMYFVGVGDYVYWYQQAEDGCKNARSAELEDEILNKYAFSISPDKAAIFDILAAQ